eukprot:scaffold201_cov405-Prasinococcus_capsulatus_cf.AAC.33
MHAVLPPASVRAHFARTERGLPSREGLATWRRGRLVTRATAAHSHRPGNVESDILARATRLPHVEAKLARPHQHERGVSTPWSHPSGQSGRGWRSLSVLLLVGWCSGRLPHSYYRGTCAQAEPAGAPL